jgi:hypothetical protein
MTAASNRFGGSLNARLYMPSLFLIARLLPRLARLIA